MDGANKHDGLWILNSTCETISVQVLFDRLQRKKWKQNKHYRRSKLKNPLVEEYGVKNIVEEIEREDVDADLVKLMTEEEEPKKE